MDDLAAVVEQLRNGHNTALVVAHDEQTEHIGVWGKSARCAPPLALEYVQEQGFTIVEAGIRNCNATGDKHGWTEVRRKEPSEVYRGDDR